MCVCGQVCMCVCACVIWKSATIKAEFYWTVEQVWILQLDHISEWDTEGNNGGEFFTVECSTIATSNTEGKEVLILGVIIFSLWDHLIEYGHTAQGPYVWGSPAVRQTCFTVTYQRCLTHPPSLLTIGMEVEIRKWDIMQTKCYDGPRSCWVIKTHLLSLALKA